ncbi:MAG TPA: Rieske 2Fe-2S domain-containing protein [Stellaceae bacterium]|nr:Rieske 2Fe-2S domain-containing protein [Stellaceae bacterium]
MPDTDAKAGYEAEVRPLDTWPDTLFDEAAFQREQTRLAHVWTVLGHVRDIAKDGDWFRSAIGTRSVFVQRFGGALRGFENRCVHRSYPLRTRDKGNGPLRCGFHHWRYDADGRAIEIPQCERLFGTTPGELGARLNPIEVATCGALIFGRFPASGRSETLEAYLGDFFPILQAMFPVAVKPQFLTGLVKANWRLCFQIAVEDYHVVAVHKGIFGKDGYLKRDKIGYHRWGLHSAFFTDPDPDGFAKMAAACRAGTWRSASYRVFHIFPNLTISHYRTDGQHWYVMAMQYSAVAADRTLMRAWFNHAPFPPAEPHPWYEPIVRLFKDPVRAPIVRYYSNKVLAQDTGVCEKLQTIARQINPAPILGGLEERIGWLDDAYRQVVGGEAGDRRRSAAD